MPLVRFTYIWTALILLGLTLPGISQVVINEVAYDADGDLSGNGVVSETLDEFIEIYNTGISSVDIGNWTVRDTNSGFVFPEGTSISPGEYISVFKDPEPNLPGQVFGGASFGLSNSGELVELLNDEGAVQDSTNDNGSTTNESWEREPDGTGEFIRARNSMYNPEVLFTPNAANAIVPKFHPPHQLTVYFLDVGQGDSTLIVSPAGKTLLIDGGDNGSGTSVIVPFLKDLGIDGVSKTLDYMVATHFDEDHIGGLDEVASEIHPLVAYDRGGNKDSITTAFTSYLDSIGSARQQMLLGQVIDLGAGVSVQALTVGEVIEATDERVENLIYPAGRVWVGASNDNELGISLKLTYGGFHLSVSGDLPGGGNNGDDVESDLATAMGDLDVYQVNHHASLTSSNENFLSVIQPEVAVVSVGNNPFGHPVQSVIDRIKSVGGAEVYQTEVGSGGLGDYVANGTIILKTDGGIYSLEGGDLERKFYRVDDPARILFDNTREETAANADWILDEDSRYPEPRTPGSSNDWAGALSSWGYDLYLKGHSLETLPSSASLTYNDTSNPQDLSLYDAYIVPEPHTPLFSPEERQALLDYVNAGGGLMMIADHNGSERGTERDSDNFWNDFLTQATLPNPFGITFNAVDISFNGTGDGIGNVSTNFIPNASETVLYGEAGSVEGIAYYGGTHITVNSNANSSVHALAWRNTIPQSNTTEAILARSDYGLGRVVAVGDSSMTDDGEGHPGDTLYNNYNDPSNPEETHDVLLINAAQFLAGPRSSKIFPGQIVINELRVDHTGSAEFVEIAGPPGLSLQGCSLWGIDASSDPAFGDKLVSLDGQVISENGYFVVGNGSVANVDLFDPGEIPWGDNIGAIQLRYQLTVLDQVGYGLNGFGIYYEGNGPAPMNPDDGDAIGRDSNSTDTNDNQEDFRIVLATPGEANPAQINYQGLLITEVSIKSIPDEFVELANLSGHSLPLEGVILTDEESSNTEGAIRFPHGTASIGAGEVVIVLLRATSASPPTTTFQNALVPGTRLFGLDTDIAGYTIEPMEDYQTGDGGTGGDIAMSDSGDNMALLEPSATFSSSEGITDHELVIDGMNYGNVTAGFLVPAGPGIDDVTNALTHSAGNSLQRTSAVDHNDSSVDFLESAITPGQVPFAITTPKVLWQVH